MLLFIKTKNLSSQKGQFSDSLLRNRFSKKNSQHRKIPFLELSQNSFANPKTYDTKQF